MKDCIALCFSYKGKQKTKDSQEEKIEMIYSNFIFTHEVQTVCVYVKNAGD